MRLYNHVLRAQTYWKKQLKHLEKGGTGAYLSNPEIEIARIEGIISALDWITHDSEEITPPIDERKK